MRLGFPRPREVSDSPLYTGRFFAEEAERWESETRSRAVSRRPPGTWRGRAGSGAREERKGEAKDELKREEREASRQEAAAQRETENAERRAQRAADRERSKAQPQKARARSERGKAEAKATEVEGLERRTGGSGSRASAKGQSKDELYAEAQRLDIDGRSSMNKDELRRAVGRAR